MTKSKEITYIRIDGKLKSDFREVAERQNWKFQAAMQIAVEDFVNRYRDAELIPRPARR